MHIDKIIAPIRASLTKPGARVALGALAVAGGTAAYVSWAAQRAEAKHPPRGRLMEVDRVRIHFIDRGEGPVILLLHGKGSMASDFEGSGLIDALAAHHRVIAIDRPGFGYSERPRDRSWNATEQAKLFAATLGHLGIPSAIVVGHSFGASCALALALEAPHLVSKLVLLGGYYYPAPRAKRLSDTSAIPVVGDFMNYTASAVAARFALGKLQRRKFSPQPVADAFLQAVPKEMLLRPAQMFAEAAESLMIADEAERLSLRYDEIKHPITLLAGDEDAALETASQSKKLHEALPHSKLKVIEKAGHMLHYAAPQTILAAIEEAAQQKPSRK
jgi:pimeloyl-ACP methyl ester carboxylesterase